MKMINVIDDWTWIKKHATEEMMEDEKLENDVLAVARKYRIEPVHIIELYSEGLSLHLESSGGKDGKYLSFKDWFYEFYQMQEQEKEGV